MAVTRLEKMTVLPFVILSEAKDLCTLLDRNKKAGTQESVPAFSWLVARIKLLASIGAEAPCDTRCLYAALKGRSSTFPLLFHAYALRLGRTVKSLTWVRMLDICIPFSCATNGSNSAIN